MTDLNEVRVRALEPFEVDPLVLAEHLLAEASWWRFLRRRRLRREVARLRLQYRSWINRPFVD